MSMDLKKIKVGVVGNGMVGNAIARGLIEFVKEVRIWDILPEKRTHLLQDVLDCEFVFLCLPTPEGEDGKCDTSALDEFFRREAAVQEGLGDESNPVYVIKSTVPIGYTQSLAYKYPSLTILHSPEFLTARVAVTDFQIPSRNIVGVPCAPDGDRDAGNRYIAAGLSLRAFYLARFPGVPVYRMAAMESEAVKLFQNSFFALKVTFFNAAYEIAGAYGLNWDSIRQGLLADGRIAHSHTQVPGPDGQRGFGGACLPKDIQNLRECSANVGLQEIDDWLDQVVRLNWHFRYGQLPLEDLEAPSVEKREEDN